MALELLTGINVQEGLGKLGPLASSTGQIMLARVETPVLEDNTNLWTTWFDSRTQNHHGGVNEDNRHQFKVDHGFDLDAIVNASISSEGSMPTSKQAYEQSPATEFVIIGQSDLKGADADYAIRADKYESVREQLIQGRYEAKALEKAGGFKINQWLKPEEIIRYKGAEVESTEGGNIDKLTWEGIEYVHDGWLEHAVGKSNATQEEYLEAAKLLAKYVAKAQKESFRDGIGMGFFVGTNAGKYSVRPWYINNSGSRSDAIDGSSFHNPGRFLWVPDAVINK